MKKTISLFIALLLLLAVFSSCSEQKVEDPEKTDTSTASTAEPADTENPVPLN